MPLPEELSDEDLTWKDKEETVGEDIKVESEIENGEMHNLP